jgi:undecaprenyl diphosphate synthase
MRAANVKMNNKLNHIAVICDGNRRWAKARGLPESEGHLASVAPLRALIESWQKKDIPHLSFWWSSADNIRRRDRSELEVLYEAYSRFFDTFNGCSIGIELRAYGQWRELLPSTIVRCVSTAIERNPQSTTRVLSFLLAYNGDEEMFELIDRIRRSHDLTVPVDENLIRRYLPTGDLPPVDIVIRTGGDPHLSTGFMMWQTRYAQLWFTETLWPDFSAADLERALSEYVIARRCFGR